MRTYNFAMTIAGSDSGGCAGIQADLKTFSSLGVFGTSVITALTAQNTIEVKSIHAASTEIIREQIRAVLEDFKIEAIKTGMLFSPENIKAISEELDQNIPLVIDPVMVATSGNRLIKDQSVEYIKNYLYPIASLITPNLDETSILLGKEVRNLEEMKHAAKEFIEKDGLEAVLVKGGHLKESIGSDRSIDVFYSKEIDKPIIFETEMVDTKNTHGTGCTLSAAIAAYIALGYGVKEAVEKSKDYIYNAIIGSKDVYIANGAGAVDHFHNPKKLNIREIK